jgi:hypothetical protein
LAFDSYASSEHTTSFRTNNATERLKNAKYVEADVQRPAKDK